VEKAPTTGRSQLQSRHRAAMRAGRIVIAIKGNAKHGGTIGPNAVAALPKGTPRATIYLPFTSPRRAKRDSPTTTTNRRYGTVVQQRRQAPKAVWCRHSFIDDRSLSQKRHLLRSIGPLLGNRSPKGHDGILAALPFQRLRLFHMEVGIVEVL
jgi:hypothetical protein